MNYKKFLAAASAALMIAFVVTLVLTSGVWAVSTEKVLYSFTGGADGGEPHQGLVFDHAGNLYGTTFDGGLYGVGLSIL